LIVGLGPARWNRRSSEQNRSHQGSNHHAGPGEPGPRTRRVVK
jgi:hypothetical protein